MPVLLAGPSWSTFPVHPRGSWTDSPSWTPSSDTYANNWRAAMGTKADFEVVSAVLSPEPISVDQAIAAVESDTAGAVVSFSGVVRNHDGGKGGDRLSYSAHPTAHRIMSA